ncbi:MAG: type II toxin-antitoxin system HicA family toxin [Saprospiraceae bacterium]|nr:type II toxin-antitoxin system HicA family toxin [Saprospiraceae bacterium]
MSNIPSLTSKEVIKILIQKGFVLDRSKGSHQIWLHPKNDACACQIARLWF